LKSLIHDTFNSLSVLRKLISYKSCSVLEVFVPAEAMFITTSLSWALLLVIPLAFASRSGKLTRCPGQVGNFL
jgi:hypothetical protein